MGTASAVPQIAPAALTRRLTLKSKHHSRVGAASEFCATIAREVFECLFYFSRGIWWFSQWRRFCSSALSDSLEGLDEGLVLTAAGNHALKGAPFFKECTVLWEDDS
jgi:hypothetical protein